MDKQLHTPEEEFYLRMLDREVPDLWGRIEAGLDKAETEQKRAENREQRFLATQESGQIIPFRQDKVKNEGRKRKVGLIIGIAAAAVVVIGSLTIFGLSRRDADLAEDKMDSTALPQYEMKVDEGGSAKADESVDSLDIQEKQNMRGDGLSKKDQTNNSVSEITVTNEQMEDFNQGGVPAAEEAQQSESAKEEEDARDAAEDAPGGAGSVNHYLCPSGVSVNQLSLGSMMALESERGIVRIFRNVEGQMKVYRFYGRDEAGQVLLLEEDIFLSKANAEEKRQNTIAFDSEHQLRIGEVEGELEFILPE